MGAVSVLCAFGEERRDGSVPSEQSVKGKTWFHRDKTSLELRITSMGRCVSVWKEISPGASQDCICWKKQSWLVFIRKGQAVEMAGAAWDRVRGRRPGLGPWCSLQLAGTALGTLVYVCHSAVKRIKWKKKNKEKASERRWCYVAICR